MAQPAISNSANSQSKDLGNLELTPEIREDLIDDVLGEARLRSITELEAENSEIILEALQLRAVYF
jgi:hypothetical protein